MLASASEDGGIRLWEMENGGNIRTIAAHAPGVASLRFLKDGRLLSTGRDRFVRLWDQNGGKQREFEPFGDLALEAVINQDETRVFAADWTGEIRVWDAKDGRRLANLAVNPAPIAGRIELTRQTLAAAVAEADSLAKQIVPLQNAIPGSNARCWAQEFQTKLTAAEKAAGKQTAVVQQLEQAQKAKAAVVDDATLTLKAADGLAAQLAAGQTAAEKAVVESVQAEKAATDALGTAKTATEKALSDKTSNDPALVAATVALKTAATPEATAAATAELLKQAQKTLALVQALADAGARQSAASTALARATAAKNAAPGTAVTARTTAKAAALAVSTARDLSNKALQEKAAAEKTLADGRAALQNLTTALAAVKKDHAQASAAKAGAEKALAEKKAPLDATLAKVQALKAELEALAVEQKRSAPATGAKGGLASAAQPGTAK